MRAGAKSPFGTAHANLRDNRRLPLWKRRGGPRWDRRTGQMPPRPCPPRPGAASRAPAP